MQNDGITGDKYLKLSTNMPNDGKLNQSKDKEDGCLAIITGVGEFSRRNDKALSHFAVIHVRKY